MNPRLRYWRIGFPRGVELRYRDFLTFEYYAVCVFAVLV